MAVSRCRVATSGGGRVVRERDRQDLGLAGDAVEPEAGAAAGDLVGDEGAVDAGSVSRSPFPDVPKAKPGTSAPRRSPKLPSTPVSMHRDGDPGALADRPDLRSARAGRSTTAGRAPATALRSDAAAGPADISAADPTSGTRGQQEARRRTGGPPRDAAGRACGSGQGHEMTPGGASSVPQTSSSSSSQVERSRSSSSPPPCAVHRHHHAAPACAGSGTRPPATGAAAERSGGLLPTAPPPRPPPAP